MKTYPKHFDRRARPPAKRTRKRQDNTDLDKLLEMELDDVFLVPKTMLEEDGASAEGGKDGVRHSSGSRHRPRNLQEGGVSNPPSPSPADPTGAPTAANDRGISSSYFSYYYETPSAAPTAAPTIGKSDDFHVARWQAHRSRSFCGRHLSHVFRYSFFQATHQLRGFAAAVCSGDRHLW